MIDVQDDMPKEPSNSTQMSIRLANETLDQLDELARAMSRPGIELSRADAIRGALARGIQELQAEFKLARPASVLRPAVPRSHPSARGKR
jgi:predicted DNA-binding protein